MKEKGKIKMADEKKHENSKRKKKLKNRKERQNARYRDGTNMAFYFKNERSYKSRR